MTEKRFIEHIRLVEIVEVPERPGHAGVHLKITMGFFDERNHPALQSTWYLARKDWPDNSILPVAKNWFHRLCKDIGNATQDWLLSDDQFEALRRIPTSKSPS